jgi:hypothetical protein
MKELKRIFYIFLLASCFIWMCVFFLLFLHENKRANGYARECEYEEPDVVRYTEYQLL